MQASHFPFILLSSVDFENKKQVFLTAKVSEETSVPREQSSLCLPLSADQEGPILCEGDLEN